MAEKKEPERDGGANSIVAEAKIRFERARDALKDNRALAVADTKFVMGDSDNGWQWPEQLFQNRSQVEKRPCLTVNVTAQHCNQIINNIRQNRPQCKVLPADSSADKKTAEIFGGLIRNIQVASNADLAHDMASEHAIYGGEGYWRICTDYETPTSFDQVICVEPLENPQLVYIDPYCGPNRLNAQWGFIFEDITKEACRKYGVEPASWDADTKRGWVNDETVRIAEYFYCTNEPDTLYLQADGTTALESELLKRGGKELVAQAKQVAAQIEAMTGGKAARETSTPKWKYCKLIGGHDKPIDEKEWAGSYMPIISVVGKELNVNGKIVRKGVVRDLKDPARMVNYSYSGAIETVSLQNKIPYIAAAEAIEGYEPDWASANQSQASYLPYNATDESGNPLPRPERQQSAVMPSAQVSMLQLSVEQMRAASGQQNANFGIRSEASSGVGIQRLKAQGEIATFHFPDNLSRALHDEAVILIDLIPKIYDTRRIVRILGIDGKESNAVLDPEHPQAHGEIDQGDIGEIFNPSVGRYDVVIDTGPSYQTQRQEAAAAMTELSSRNPQLMQVAGDLLMKSFDFPFADQLAERLKKALPPQFQDDGKKGEEIPPAVQQQMQQMQEQLKQLSDALGKAGDHVEKLESEKEIELQKLALDAYGKETDRLKVVGTSMTPEQVQMLVMQTLQTAFQTPAPGPQIQEDLQEYEHEEDEREAGESGAQEHAEMQSPEGRSAEYPQLNMDYDPGEQPEQSEETQAPPGAFFTPEMDATGAQPGLD